MDLDNPAADVSGLGIPGNVIADFESFSHLILLIASATAHAARGLVTALDAASAAQSALVPSNAPDGNRAAIRFDQLTGVMAAYYRMCANRSADCRIELASATKRQLASVNAATRPRSL